MKRITSIISLIINTAAAYALSPQPQLHAQSTANISVTGNIKPTTCSIRTTDISVNLAKIPIGEMASVPPGGTHSISGEGKLHFDCPMAGANIHITLTDSSQPTSSAPYLSLLETHPKASGVGIQMFCADGHPIPLKQNADCLDGLQLPQGAYETIVRARYYRTADTLRPGYANAKATFSVYFD